MAQRHIDDIDQVAREIYSFAAQRINAFMEKEQQHREQYPVASQLEDFHLIAERASIYLMGNAIAALDESVQEECIEVQNKHLRAVISTIRSMSVAPNGPIN